MITNSLKGNTASKLIVAVMTLVMLLSSAAISYGASGSLKKPKISSLKSSYASSMTVKSNRISGAKGFQIRYALNKSFKSAKKVTVKGSKLNKTIGDLKQGKTYYVKIRAYKLVKNKKKYSGWSAIKTVKISDGAAYTKSVLTTLYTKKDTNSPSVQVWYDTKLKVYSVSSNSAGKFSKVRIGNGKKYYYLWESKGESKLKKSSAKTANYAGAAGNDYQKAVVKEALRIMNEWKTAYDYDKTASDGSRNSNGVYLFDCSGFATYVVNKVMNSYSTYEDYYLPWNIEQLYSTSSAMKGVSVKTVCKGKIDTSKLKPGDLIFFKQVKGSSKKADHVAIYLGKGVIIQSTKTISGYYTDSGKNTKGGVCVAPITGASDGLYVRTFVEAKRVIPE